MTTHPHDRFHTCSRYFLCALAVALVTASCSDGPTSPASPTKVGSSGGVSFSAQSDTVVAQPVPHPICPSVAPFNVPLVIIVRPHGALDLVVTQIQMQFTDSFGMNMPAVTLPAPTPVTAFQEQFAGPAITQTPSVTLPAPVPITQFGDALAAARDDLRFPVSMGIGCGVGRTGRIDVHVSTRDGRGRQDSGRMSVNVR